MKKVTKILFIFFVSCTIINGYAESPKREFRATWFTTLQSIDFPRNHVDTNDYRMTVPKQQKEMRDMLDELKAGNLNAFCIQARPTSDALYDSPYEPWCSSLTGKRGLNPGYDVLQYAVTEGHKRGLEAHIWVNPFRVTTTGYIDTTDIVWKNCKQWIIKYDNGSFTGQIIDPGYPEARAYVVRVLMHMIRNYDVDGIIMDDYFYPYGGTTTEDAASKKLYKPTGMDDGDWRRSNVDATMQLLYDSIQMVKPWVRFGMGPFGIWTTQKAVAQQYGITLPTGITGLDDYKVQCCNTVEWVKGGYVDYIAPQLYWSTTSSGQSYHRLSKWWAEDVCEHFSNLLPGNKKVHFFSANAAYRFDAVELGKELDDNRKYAPFDAPGAIWYNTNSYIYTSEQSGDKKMHMQLRNTHYSRKALPPAMDWKESQALSAPTSIRLDGTVLHWTHPTAERYTVYAYPKGTNKTNALSRSFFLIDVVYGDSIDLASVSDLANKTLAVCAYDRYGVESEPKTYNEGPDDPSMNIAVTGISLDQTELHLAINTSAQLTANVVPANATNKEIIWRSEDADIAIVVNGLVTFMGQGSTEILAITDDGNYTASCTVGTFIPVTGITLRVRTATMNAGSTKQLSPIISPKDADNQKVHWTSSDEHVATITEEGLITAVSAGKATMTVTTDDGGFTATCEITVVGSTAVEDIQVTCEPTKVATPEGVRIQHQNKQYNLLGTEL